MRTKGTTGRDWVVGRLADRQHGVVSRVQLIAAGLSHDQIVRALKAGRLRPVFRGVYAVGHGVLSRKGWWQAALLACGAGATLSHGSACQLWNLRQGPTEPITLTVSSGRGRKIDGIVASRRPLAPESTMRIDRLAVTTPARTIVDMATRESPRGMRELVERAQDRGHFHPKAMRTEAAGARGGRPLLDLLEVLEPNSDNARSHLERLFLTLVRGARLPRPRVNEPIDGRRRDFVWPGQRLVVETDGYRYHSSPAALRRAKARDRRLVVLGWRPARFTYEDVAFEPDVVAAELADLLYYAPSR
jgi:very-short-patch-repair endonuclease